MMNEGRSRRRPVVCPALRARLRRHERELPQWQGYNETVRQRISKITNRGASDDDLDRGGGSLHAVGARRITFGASSQPTASGY
jgi:hypothetical protein